MIRDNGLLTKDAWAWGTRRDQYEIRPQSAEERVSSCYTREASYLGRRIYQLDCAVVWEYERKQGLDYRDFSGRPIHLWASDAYCEQVGHRVTAGVCVSPLDGADDPCPSAVHPGAVWSHDPLYLHHFRSWEEAEAWLLTGCP